MENALDSNAENIEIRFYRKGLNGFDIIYDGDGISDAELPLICKCMPMRERNEIYKTRSIGYRGEAFNSIAKSSSLTVITKSDDSEFPWKVKYNVKGEISNIEQYDKCFNQGTTIQVRDIHKNNEAHRKKFFATIPVCFESTMALLTTYSYRFYDRTLVVSQALKSEDADKGNIQEIFRTGNSPNFFPHVISILKNQFRNSYPNMKESMVEWEHSFYPDTISIRCIQSRPGNHKHALLIKKCLHIFLNGRPA